MPKKITLLEPAAGYNAHALFYDQKQTYLDCFEQEKFLPALGDLNNKKVLDVGAGTGRLSLRLSARGAKVTALDISPDMLEILNKKNKPVIPAPQVAERIQKINLIKTVMADVESLPFPDNTFDLVTAAFLIVHLKLLKYFFSEAQRVLKPSGLLALTNINQKRPPALPSSRGRIMIESYYHQPKAVVTEMEKLAFTITKNIFIKDKNVWINQIIVAKK